MVSVSRKKKLQYGGSVKGSKPGKPGIEEYKKTPTQGAFKRGAFATGRTAKSIAIGTAKTTLGVVTSPLTVVPGLAAGITAGTGHLALAGVKSLYHAPVTIGKRIMEHSARNKLRKELGVAYPESQKKLGQIEAQKIEYDLAHNAKVAKLFKKSDKKGYDQAKFNIELAKLQAEKNKKTENLFRTLSQFHTKKGLGGVSNYTTSFFGRSKKGETTGYNPLNSTQYEDTEKTMNEFFTARLKKAQNNLEQSYEAGKKKHSDKQADFMRTDSDFLELKNQFKERKNELDTKKNKVNSETEEVDKLQKNSNSNPNDYSKKYALELGKKKLVKALKLKKDAETAAIEAEKKMLKKTPKDIDFYEGKYYNRKQSRKNSQSRWWKNFTNAGRTFKNVGRKLTPGLGIGLKNLYGEKQTQSNINAAKTAASKNKYSSEYSLRSSFDIKTFGFGKITSKHDQSKKIGSVLFDSQKTLTVLEEDIKNVKEQLKNATTPEDKRDKLKELYSLISDKNLRTQLLRSGETLSMNLINEQEFKDNIEKLKSITVPAGVQANMDTIKNNNTPIDEKIRALDTEIKRLDAIAKISSGETYKKNTADLQVMKQLFTYYNTKDLQGKIQQELSPQRTKLNEVLGIKTKSDIERSVESFEKKINASDEEITKQTSIFAQSKLNLANAEPAFDIIDNQITENSNIIKNSDNVIETNNKNIKAKEKEYYRKEEKIRVNEAKIAQNKIKIAKLLAENNTANTSLLLATNSKLESENLDFKTNQSTLSQDIDTLKEQISEEQSVKDGAMAENQEFMKSPDYTNYVGLRSELKANKLELVKQLTDRESITDQLHKAIAKLPMNIKPNVPPPGPPPP